MNNPLDNRCCNGVSRPLQVIQSKSMISQGAGKMGKLFFILFTEIGLYVEMFLRLNQYWKLLSLLQAISHHSSQQLKSPSLGKLSKSVKTLLTTTFVYLMISLDGYIQQSFLVFAMKTYLK